MVVIKIFFLFTLFCFISGLSLRSSHSPGGRINIEQFPSEEENGYTITLPYSAYTFEDDEELLSAEIDQPAEKLEVGLPLSKENLEELRDLLILEIEEINAEEEQKARAQEASPPPLEKVSALRIDIRPESEPQGDLSTMQQIKQINKGVSDNRPTDTSGIEFKGTTEEVLELENNENSEVISSEPEYMGLNEMKEYLNQELEEVEEEVFGISQQIQQEEKVVDNGDLNDVIQILIKGEEKPNLNEHHEIPYQTFELYDEEQPQVILDQDYQQVQEILDDEFILNLEEPFVGPVVFPKSFSQTNQEFDLCIRTDFVGSVLQDTIMFDDFKQVNHIKRVKQIYIRHNNEYIFGIKIIYEMICGKDAVSDIFPAIPAVDVATISEKGYEFSEDEYPSGLRIKIGQDKLERVTITNNYGAAIISAGGDNGVEYTVVDNRKILAFRGGYSNFLGFMHNLGAFYEKNNSIYTSIQGAFNHDTLAFDDLQSFWPSLTESTLYYTLDDIVYGISNRYDSEICQSSLLLEHMRLDPQLAYGEILLARKWTFSKGEYIAHVSVATGEGIEGLMIQNMDGFKILTGGRSNAVLPAMTEGYKLIAFAGGVGTHLQTLSVYQLPPVLPQAEINEHPNGVN